MTTHMMVHGLTVKIDAKGEQCFYETVKTENVKMQIQFQVASGGFLDIDFKLYNPKGEIVHQVHKESEGKFTFTAVETGDYKLCFSNAMSTLTPKVVTFTVHVGDLLDPQLTKIDQTDPIVRSILRLTEGLAEIQNEQKYLRMREHNHRDLAEETNDKIFYWSIVEILVLIVTSVAQVFILKRFFKEDKRRF
jgi:hypothetical protein